MTTPSVQEQPYAYQDPDQPPRKGLSLRRNFSWTLVGNIIYAGCQWAMLMLIAKIGNPEMVGRFALGLAITAPIIMFSNLDLRVVQATDAREDYTFRSYLALRVITTSLATLVIVGIVVCARYPWETMLTVILIGVAKAFEAISDIYYGLFQQHERLDRIATSMILKGFLSLLLLGAGVYLTGSILWGAIGLACAWALTLLTYDIRNARSVLLLSMPGEAHAIQTALTPQWHATLLWQLTLFTLPLGVMVLLQSLNANIPRYFVDHHLGEHALGIFAALTYIMVAGTTIVRALGQSASPVLAKQYVAGRLVPFFRLIALLIGTGFIIGVVGVGIAAVAGRWILRILYTPEYANYASLFVSLMFASIFLYIAQFLDYCTTIVRNFRAQMLLSVLVTGVTLALCVWLIPRAGLFGASQALLWCGVVKVVGNLAILGYAARAARRTLASAAAPVHQDL